MRKNLPVTDREIPFPLERYLVSKTDLKGCITHVNDTFVNVSGFSRSELIGASHNIVRHPDMPEQAFEDLWHTVKQGKPWNGMVKNRAKNGDFYWVDAFVVPVMEDGKVVEYMSVRTQPTEEQIQQADLLYKKLRTQGGKLPKPKQGFSLSLRIRLAMLVSTALIAIFAISGIALFNGKSGQHEVDEITHQLVEPALNLSKAQQSLDTSYQLAQKIAISAPEGDALKKQLAAVQQSTQQASKQLNKLESTSTNDLEHEKLAYVQASAELLDRGLLPVIDLLAQQRLADANLWLVQKTAPLSSQVKLKEHNFELALEDHLKQSQTEQRANSFAAFTGMIAISVLAIILLIVVAWFQMRAILRPMSGVIAHFHRIASGVLSDKVDISRKDEFGEMYCALATMQTSVKVMLDNVRDGVMSLQQNSADLDAQMYVVMMQSKQQQHQVEVMANTVHEFSAAVIDVADKAQQASSVAIGSQQYVDACNDTMQQSMLANQRLLSTVKQTNFTITELNQSITKIGDVFKVVRRIAKQTNLLALNAAVEAARAGDAGLGFAVVADEVRMLAESTGRSTKDIASLVEEISQLAMMAVASMQSAIEEVEEGVAKMQDSMVGLNNITSASNEVTNMAEMISSTASQQAQAGGEVVGEMELVAASVQQNTEIAQQASQLAKDVMATAEQMRMLMAQFQLFKNMGLDGTEHLKAKPPTGGDSMELF